MRTTLDLPDPLFKEVKTRAVQQGVTLKELLASFIEAGLRGSTVPQNATNPAEKRRPLPVGIPRIPDAPLHPALSNAELYAILEAEDIENFHREVKSETKPHGPTPELDALLAEIATRHPSFSCRDNLTRDALYESQ